MKKKILMLAMLSAGSVFCTHCVGSVVTIPVEYESIRQEAFSGRTDITRVEFVSGSDLKVIGNGAFYGCRNLAFIRLPETLESIGNGAFVSCAIKDVKIPPSVSAIGDSAFAGCSSLESMTLSPGALTWIGDRAFADCCNLGGVIVIPEGVVHIGKEAFDGCPAKIILPSTIDPKESQGAFLNCKAKEIKINLNSRSIEGGVVPFLNTLFDKKRGVSVIFEDGAIYEYTDAGWTRVR
jgi:hypothetical protein